MKPKLLDLYCGAGGCAAGYAAAGFEVTGVDIQLKKRFPFKFVQADALTFLKDNADSFDAFTASPPCQKFSMASMLGNHQHEHADLLTPTRTALQETRAPWIMENVPQAPLARGAAELCGLMFGLKVFRHRRFEANFVLFTPPHPTHAGHVIGQRGMITAAGNGGGISRQGRKRLAEWRAAGHVTEQTKRTWATAMQIDWMSRPELAQAIPPAYTHFLGLQLMTQVLARR